MNATEFTLGDKVHVIVNGKVYDGTVVGFPEDESEIIVETYEDTFTLPKGYVLKEN